MLKISCNKKSHVVYISSPISILFVPFCLKQYARSTYILKVDITTRGFSFDFHTYRLKGIHPLIKQSVLHTIVHLWLSSRMQFRNLLHSSTSAAT